MTGSVHSRRSDSSGPAGAVLAGRAGVERSVHRRDGSWEGVKMICVSVGGTLRRVPLPVEDLAHIGFGLSWIWS